MSKFIKSHSNYILKKQHQLVKDGKIFERDWTTIQGTNKYTAGQIPLYAESNFKITVRSGIFGKKKHNFGKWIKNCNETSDEWTIENLNSCDVDTTIDSNKVELNQVSNNILDFAYYGSATELIRSSVENIIKYFPAELFFGQNKQDYVKEDNTIDYINGWVVDNPFKIDLFSEFNKSKEYENKLRYFSESFGEYEVIIGNNIYPVTSFKTESVPNIDLRCLKDGELIKNITIGYNNSIINLKLYYANNEKVLIYDDLTQTNIHIRPNKNNIENFFNLKLDGFQKLLLDRKTKPLYKHNFITPINTNYGITFVNRDYIWPIVNEWNLDIMNFPYSSYIGSLTKMSLLFDELYSNNLYRSMTHEAIKNFDWTYTREYYKGEKDDYVVGGSKISNLLHLYGRGLDDLKRYIDGIKFTSTITYNNINNSPNSLIMGKLDLKGWIVTSTVENGKENVLTDPLFPGEQRGYTFSEANIIFLKNLFINSKAIWKAKGTKRSVEMIMSLFGIKREWYDLKEFVYTVSPKTDNIDNIIALNQRKDVLHNNLDNDYDGLLVKEFYSLNKNNEKSNRRLYPWCNNGEKYDGNVVFQGSGGWGKTSNGVYRETVNYTNVVDTINELLALPIKSVENGDIYYVISESTYFKLINKNNLRTIGDGWKSISNDDPQVKYLSSIIDVSQGNNPHVGFGKYDDGKTYLDYLKTIFKFSIDNNRFKGSDLNLAKSIGGFSISNIIEDNKKCWSLFRNGNNNSIVSKTQRSYDNKFRKTSYTINQNHDTVNVKTFVIKNVIGGVNFSNYFMTHILPYVEQVLPSTVLYQLEGFQTGNGKNISLSKNEVFLNEGKDSDEVILSASESWEMVSKPNNAEITPISGNKTNGTTLKIKKKNSYGGETVKFRLKNDHSVSTYLNIRNSMISINPKTWNIPSSGNTNMDFKIIVDGKEASSNEYTYISTNPNVIVSKNSSFLTAKSLINNNTSPINGVIKVTHFFDQTCVDDASINQEASNMSINANPNSYSFKTNGGDFVIDVNVNGGDQDFIYTLPSNDWLSIVEKTKTSLKVKALPNLTVVDSIPVTITVKHKNNVNLTDSIVLTQKANTNLSINVNPSQISFDAGQEQKEVTVIVGGGSEAYKIDMSSVPSWLTVTSDGYKILIGTSQNNEVFNREYTLKISHLDNDTISTTLKIVQQSYGELKIEVSPESYEFPFYKSANDFIIKVYGGSKNFTFVTTDKWFTITKNSGEDLNNYQSFTLKVDSTENKTTENKSGKITLYHSDNTNVTTIINLTQEPQAAFSINAELDGVNISEINDINCEGYTSGDKYKIKVIIKPDGSDYAVTSAPNWITYNKISGVNNEKYLQLFISPNKFATSRSENIMLTHSIDPSITKKIKLTQKACEPFTLLINDKQDETLDVEASGGTHSFNIKITGGDKKYIIDLPDSWISVDSGAGISDLETMKVTILPQPEISLGVRSGIIKLTHFNNKSVVASLVITQKESLSISKSPTVDMLNISSGGDSKVYTIIPRGGSGQCVILSQQPSWVSVNKNGNKLSINISVNTASEKREHTITIAHADDQKLTTTILIQQDGFTPSVTIVTNEKVLELCPFKPSVGCECNCDNDCNSGTTSNNRIQDKTYDVITVGGSGKWVVKGFAASSCCDNDDSACTDNLIEVDWIDARNLSEQLVVDINENRVETSPNGDTIDREVCLVVQHRDKADIVDKIKIKQKKALKTYKNHKIEVVPTNIMIPARGDDKIVGSGMDAKYYYFGKAQIKSTKDKFINCQFEKTVYVPWNATTDCKDSPSLQPCEFLLNGRPIEGKLTKVVYNKFSENGGNGSLPIYSSKSWTATVSAGGGWINVSSQGNTNIGFSVSKNDTCLERTGAIIVESCDGKQINIEIVQNKGHNCVLNVIPVHPIPTTIPPEGGIYKYRVASYDCDGPVAWDVSASNCTVLCKAGYGGGTESVGVTVKVDKSEGGGKSVSVKFQQRGNSSCTLQTETIDGSQENPPSPGGGDCNCPECKTLWHTDQNIHNLDYRAKKAYFQVYYSCKECKPIPWIVKLDAPLTANVYSGVGYCCPEWQCVDFDAEAKKICIGKTPATFTVNIPENDTGVERIMNMYITQNGEGCDVGQQEWIKQSPKPTGSTCTDCYVAFQNADTRTIESGAKTYSSEPIVKKGTGSGCNIDVNSFSITASDGKTGDVTINPSTGDLSSTNISIAENTSSSDRTFTITIHPNIDEKVDCKPLATFAMPHSSQVIINGEVYSDYTDEDDIGNTIRNGSDTTIFTPSSVDRVKYTPDSTVIKGKDEIGDPINSVEFEDVKMEFGENRDPQERVCKIIFEQKEVNEKGVKEKQDFIITQEAAVVEYKEHEFSLCPGSLTIGADGGVLVASIKSVASKYINGIKREINVPINYSTTCQGETWATINSNNIINVQPNTDFENDRIMTFTFKQDDSALTKELIVFQKRKSKDFTYNMLTYPLSLRFDLTGGTQTLDVKSIMMEIIGGIEQNPKTIGYTVIGTSPWCTINTANNTVTCEENKDSLESRSMTFIFTQDKSGINHTVLVEQGEQFEYVFEILPKSLSFEAEGGELPFTVKSELIPVLNGIKQPARELKYVFSESIDWCVVNVTNSTFMCNPNEDKENARVTTFILTQEKTGLITSITIFQKKPDILPELYEYIDTADEKLQTQIDDLSAHVDDADANLQSQIDALASSGGGGEETPTT